MHPLWRNDELIAYSNSEGIHVSAYCPMGTPWTSAKVQTSSPCLSSTLPISCVSCKNARHLPLESSWQAAVVRRGCRDHGL